MPNLLIVEDQPVLREVLKAACENDFMVKTAGDGAEALEILSVWQTDVVITDYSMPKMNGLELIKEIKNSGNDKIKIILLSASLNDDLISRAIGLGASACMSKPFNLEELKQLARELAL